MMSPRKEYAAGWMLPEAVSAAIAKFGDAKFKHGLASRPGAPPFSEATDIALVDLYEILEDHFYDGQAEDG